MTMAFSNAPSEIKAIFQGALVRYPQLTNVMAAHVPQLPYAQYKVGAAGACLDFLCLGKCKNKECRYKHDPAAVVSESQVRRGVASKIQAAYTAYKANNT